MWAIKGYFYHASQHILKIHCVDRAWPHRVIPVVQWVTCTTKKSMVPVWVAGLNPACATTHKKKVYHRRTSYGLHYKDDTKGYQKAWLFVANKLPAIWHPVDIIVIVTAWPHFIWASSRLCILVLTLWSLRYIYVVCWIGLKRTLNIPIWTRHVKKNRISTGHQMSV